MREAGAHAFRVHTIPETAEQLKLVIEDQLVRADLIVISGESKDESFDLITSVISKLGEIKVVAPNLNESGKHSYGLIGPDKIPVVTLPGDSIANYLSAEIFIRPMILKMLGKTQIHRQVKKVKLSKALDLNSDKGSYVRAKFNPEGQVTPLTNQESLITLSEADSLIALPEKSKKLSAGDLVNVLLINRVSN